MTINKLVETYPSFYNLQGQPLENGNIYIGEENKNPETNPIEIFEDENLTIPVSQPLKTLSGYIVKNGSPINIFISEDYSITVKDKNNNIIYTELTNGINNTINDLQKRLQIDTIADLRALSEPLDTSWVSGYYTKGDGAFGSNTFEWDSLSTEADNSGTIIKLDSVTTGRYKLRYSGAIRPRFFGAIPDTDTASAANTNTTILNSIIGSFQDIELDATYYINGTLIMDAKVHIKSINRDYQIIVSSTITSDITVFLFNNTNRTNLTNVTIGGNTANHSFNVYGIDLTDTVNDNSTGCFYLDFVNVIVYECSEALRFRNDSLNTHSNIRFDRCRFRDSIGVGGNLNINAPIQQIQFENCDFRSAKTDALGNIVIDSSVITRLSFSDCIIDDSQIGDGIHVLQSSSAPIIISGCQVSYNARHGIYVDSGSTNAVFNINGSNVRLNSSKGVYLLNANTSANISGCFITDNGEEGVRTNEARINLISSTLDYNTTAVLIQNSNDSYISANRIENNELYGVFCQNSDRSNIMGNSFFQNSTSADLAANHVTVTFGTDRATISGNSFYKGVSSNRTAYAIDVQSGATTTQVIYNKVESGGQSGTILDNGTGTINTGNI